MGCTQSKIENEEAVTRCKDRKLHMKDAVAARNAFSAAHSAYAMSLKNTGAALSDYAPGESHIPHLHHSTSLPASSSSAAAIDAAAHAQAAPPMEDVLRPPPLPSFSTSPPPISRTVSMPELPPSKRDPLSASDPILEEDEDAAADETLAADALKRRRSRGRTNQPPPVDDLPEPEDPDGPPPPPSPPRQDRTRTPPPPPPTMNAAWEYFFSGDNMPGPSLGDGEEEAAIDRKLFDEMPKRSEEPSPEEPKKQEIKAAVEKEVEQARPQSPPRPEAAAAAVAALRPVAGMNRKPVVKGGTRFNLVKIFNDLDDHFLKASESAFEVSKMLEANRLHYHSNFADNRGHIDHSARVMRVITWNRSFRGLHNQDDMVDDFDSEEHETHATVLDKLLAWEKKLYDEVKAGELMKFEYQKKVASLNKLKKRGTNSEALEKAKAAVSHLHTRYIVDMQSLDSTVTEINRLRDNQLYPKLVALVEGMATMWEAMQRHHDQQTKIAVALRSLDISEAPKETSEHHHERTIQLWAVVQEWHSQFEKLVIHQKEYIKALNSWLKLNLVPIESSLREKVSSPPRPQNPPIQSLLQAWNDYLEKLPDEGARSAIYNFSAVIHTIVQHQEDEIKLKLRCEEISKELSRKKRQFEEWRRKYNQRRAQSEDAEAGPEDDSNDFVERQVAIEAIEKRLEEEEEAYKKQCNHVRDKSLLSLKSRLPELFHAMSEFAGDCLKIYSTLRSSLSQKPFKSSSSEKR